MIAHVLYCSNYLMCLFVLKCTNFQTCINKSCYMFKCTKCNDFKKQQRRVVLSELHYIIFYSSAVKSPVCYKHIPLKFTHTDKWMHEQARLQALRADSHFAQLMNDQWLPVKQNLSNDVPNLSVNFGHCFFWIKHEHQSFRHQHNDYDQPNRLSITLMSHVQMIQATRETPNK